MIGPDDKNKENFGKNRKDKPQCLDDSGFITVKNNKKDKLRK